MKRNTGTIVSFIWGWICGKERREAFLIEGLLSPEAFDEQLLKERARSDRSASVFCLLVVDIVLPRNSPPYQKAAWMLASVLHDRTRIIDTKGWFGERVAVILPNTAPVHVGKIWNNIQEVFAARMAVQKNDGAASPEITYEVYTYPSDGKSKDMHEVSRSVHWVKQ